MEAKQFKIKGIEAGSLPSLTKMSEIPLTEPICANLERLKFYNLTPIQRTSIPAVLADYDIIGIAQTGSGKTLAFVLPIISKLLQSGPPPEDTSFGLKPCDPLVLILLPTRELAIQVYNEIRKLLYLTGISAARIYGGEPYGAQCEELEIGCDFLVATPGRLLDMYNKGLVTLSQVKWLVLDEADRMLDMGFSDQLNQIAFDCDLPASKYRQNLLFSATFDNAVKKIATNYINNPLTVYSEEETTTNQNIEQRFEKVANRDKLSLLHNCLQQIKGITMVFVQTKRGCDWLYNQMINANYNVICIHGDKSQEQRNRAIKDFKTGRIPIMICTDVASRGLDFPKVEYVFNFDMPSNIDDYVHRIGRTGRGGNSGTSISFVNEENVNIQSKLIQYLKKSNQPVPEWLTFLGGSSSGNRGYTTSYSKNTYENTGYVQKKFNGFVGRKENTFASNSTMKWQRNVGFKE